VGSGTVEIAMSEPLGPEPTVRLSVPPEGLRASDVILRFPSLDDVDAILPAFTDPELREAGNLPAFDRAGLVASIQDLPACRTGTAAGACRG
jgi:hypothetical protein